MEYFLWKEESSGYIGIIELQSRNWQGMKGRVLCTDCDNHILIRPQVLDVRYDYILCEANDIDWNELEFLSLLLDIKSFKEYWQKEV